ncbi:hypothetical protein ACTHR6_26535 [Ralstonia holmesii]|uniref:hypothetical protein n=1 Tax=Ralstonia TaxID=48736 RepID=UPI000A71AE42|nr:hypothetical protein [Ralstonia pickettii]
MKPFIVRVAANGHHLTVHTIAASSIDALMRVLGALESQGVVACSGAARPLGRAA